MKSRTVMQIRRYGRSFLTVLVLAVAGLGAGFYILLQQRFPNPFISFYQVNASFPTAAAVVPGLGEPVDVAGVHVGEILGVQLHAGQGVVQMEIDPSDGVPHLFKNASAVLTPNTPLKDMYIDIDPGTPSAGVLPNNGTIAIEDTTSPTDSDELLDELDVDTRDWFTSLITALAGGTRDRGGDIRALFEALGPTAEQTETIANLLSVRRGELADIVHNLGVLTSATSHDDKQLATLVDAGDTTVHALASQDGALQQAVRLLPGVLSQTRQTFTDLTGFANELTPTATALIPVAHHLPETLADARTLIKTAALLPVGKVQTFEHAVIPLAGALTGVLAGLKVDVPALKTSFKAIEYFTNEAAYDPANGNPGFLYWIAWFAHNVDSFVGNHDANGSTWRALLMTTCSTEEDLNPTVKALLSAVVGTLGCQ
jgi:phospholipid/cholesterol/gamma-HCH transport system substrate-binding protein